MWRTSPRGWGRACGVSARARSGCICPPSAAGHRWRGGCLMRPHGGLPAQADSLSITEERTGHPPCQLQGGGLWDHAEVPPPMCTQMDPRGGRLQGGQHLAFSQQLREAHNTARPSDALRAAPRPGPTQAQPSTEARPARQSTFSTLPMIFSSKTGRTVSSSRTSSNTTPQSNSSLTFLK